MPPLRAHLGLAALLAGSCFLPAQGRAQRTMAAMTYSVSFPLGDTKLFTDNVSMIGLTLEGRYFLKPFLSIGFDLGWNEMYWNTDQTFTLGNASVTGQQYRDINFFPLMLNTHVYAGRFGRIRPYLGINGGAYYVAQRFTIGLTDLDASDWQFGVAPEAGLLISLGVGWNVLVTGKYQYPLGTGNYLGGERSFRYWSIGVGLAAIP